MPEKIAKLFADMNKTITDIEGAEGLSVINIKKAIEVIHSFIQLLRKESLSNVFESSQEEILFFKFIKPTFVSQLIFYCKVYDIEVNKPRGSKDLQKKYYYDQMDHQREYLLEEATLYAYFNSGSKFNDPVYFLRNVTDIDVSYKMLSNEKDMLFSTSHDHYFSEFIAIEKTLRFLEEQTTILSEEFNDIMSTQPSLQYTGKNVYLVQLIYALYYSKLFGDATLKMIADVIQRIFNRNLGNYYRTMQEIRIGHKPPEIFNILENALKDGMNQADANPRY